MPEFSNPVAEVPGLTNLIGIHLNDYDLSKLCNCKFLVILCRDFYLPNLSSCLSKILPAIYDCIPELQFHCIISHALEGSESVVDISICDFSELNGVQIECL